MWDLQALTEVVFLQGGVPWMGTQWQRTIFSCNPTASRALTMPQGTLFTLSASLRTGAFPTGRNSEHSAWMEWLNILSVNVSAHCHRREPVLLKLPWALSGLLFMPVPLFFSLHRIFVAWANGNGRREPSCGNERAHTQTTDVNSAFPGVSHFAVLCLQLSQCPVPGFIIGWLFAHYPHSI